MMRESTNSVYKEKRNNGVDGLNDPIISSSTQSPFPQTSAPFVPCEHARTRGDRGSGAMCYHLPPFSLSLSRRRNQSIWIMQAGCSEYRMRPKFGILLSNLPSTPLHSFALFSPLKLRVMAVNWYLGEYLIRVRPSIPHYCLLRKELEKKAFKSWVDMEEVLPFVIITPKRRIN